VYKTWIFKFWDSCENIIIILFDIHVNECSCGTGLNLFMHGHWFFFQYTHFMVIKYYANIELN